MFSPAWVAEILQDTTVSWDIDASISIPGSLVGVVSYLAVPKRRNAYFLNITSLFLENTSHLKNDNSSI